MTPRTDTRYSPLHVIGTHSLMLRPMSFLLFVIAAITIGYTMQLRADNSSTSADLQVLSTSIAAGTSGITYYADTAHSIIYAVSSSGVQTQINCCTGLTPSTLNEPRGVATDNHGDLYIADTGNNRIVEITSSSEISTVNTHQDELSRPSGIAIDAAGDIFIADSGNNRIIELTIGGQSVLVDTGNYQLSNPQAVSIDQSNSLYITDSGNNRIILVPASGSPGVLFANQLSSPLSITPDGSGDAYIAETGSSLPSSTSGQMPAAVTTFNATNMNVVAGSGSQGTIGTVKVTLTPLDNFNQTLYLEVLGLPPGAQVQLTHPIVVLDGGAAVTDTIEVGDTNTQQVSYLLRNGRHSHHPARTHASMVLAGIAPISLLLLVGLRMSRKTLPGATKVLGAIALVALLPAMLVMASGCKGGYPAGLYGSQTYTATLVAHTASGTILYPLGSFGITLQ